MFVTKVFFHSFQAKTAQEILVKLQKPSPQEKQTSLHQLSKLSNDYTFAQEFIGKQGLPEVIAMIESNA